MRMIDADALIKAAGKLWSEMPDGEELSKELMKAINHAPTVGWISGSSNGLELDAISWYPLPEPPEEVSGDAGD